LSKAPTTRHEFASLILRLDALSNCLYMQLRRKRNDRAYNLSIAHVGGAVGADE